MIALFKFNFFDKIFFNYGNYTIYTLLLLLKLYFTISRKSAYCNHNIAVRQPRQP